MADRGGPRGEGPHREAAVPSPRPPRRAREPGAITPGSPPDALVCARWAPTAERTGGYVHSWGRADLRGPRGFWGGSGEGFPRPPEHSRVGSWERRWGVGWGWEAGPCASGDSSAYPQGHISTADFCGQPPPLRPRITQPSLPSHCLSACACGKGHLPNAKGKQNKRKLFSVPYLQSWDREVVKKKNHAPIKKICEKILGSKKKKKWGKWVGRTGGQRQRSHEKGLLQSWVNVDLSWH